MRVVNIEGLKKLFNFNSPWSNHIGPTLMYNNTLVIYTFSIRLYQRKGKLVK